MPITGDPNTGVISGNVMFDFDNDFIGRTDPQKTKAYIDEFRKNVLRFWDNKDAPLTFKGNRVHVNVTFEPYVSGASGWRLFVGDGKGDLAKTLFNPADITATQKISFVKYASEVGYMFQQNNAREAAHEFGHMVRLADRYINGLASDFKQQPLGDRYDRATSPLSKCFSKELNDEANAKVGSPYDALKNLMSSPDGNDRSITDRQLGFVFSTSQEPLYSMHGWVFWVTHSEKEGLPVWLGNGITNLKTRAGVTHGSSNDEAKPCAALLNAVQYQSFRPLLFGLQYQVNKEDERFIRAFLSRRSREERQLFKGWIRQLSAMNP